MFICDINMYKIFIYVIHILFSYMITRIKFVYIFYFEHLMFRIKISMYKYGCTRVVDLWYIFYM